MRNLRLCAAVMVCAACASSTADSTNEARKKHHDAGVVMIDSPIATPDASSVTPPDAPASTPGVGPYFTSPMFFNTDVSGVAKAANSDSLISALVTEGGWGNSNVMQIDYEIDVLGADNSTPMQTFTTTGDFFSPDCDHVPMPVPAGGNVEGETGYACTGGGDCHLIVHDPAEHKLYEMWKANIVGSTFRGGCLAVWDEARVYGPKGRGE